MSGGRDPRLTPARPDLAASGLRGAVVADRYVEGEVQEVIAAQAPLRKAPSHAAPLLTEALRGERMLTLDFNEDGWAWGQLLDDGYVGWMPAAALLAPRAAPTHTVTALRTFLFSAPDVKAPAVEALPFGARIAVTRMQEPFAVTDAGFLHRRHIAPLEARERDPAAVAERFLGVPYLWGGKTALGIDCSGLVQVALSACGIACPRDSDMQQAAFGRTVARGEIRRGDLIFWKGHVAMARDAATIVHANAFHMQVAVEPLEEAAARIGGSEFAGIRRPR